MLKEMIERLICKDKKEQRGILNGAGVINYCNVSFSFCHPCNYLVYCFFFPFHAFKKNYLPQEGIMWLRIRTYCTEMNVTIYGYDEQLMVFIFWEINWNDCFSFHHPSLYQIHEEKSNNVCVCVGVFILHNHRKVSCCGFQAWVLSWKKSRMAYGSSSKLNGT